MRISSEYYNYIVGEIKNMLPRDEYNSIMGINFRETYHDDNLIIKNAIYYNNKYSKILKQYLIFYINYQINWDG